MAEARTRELLFYLDSKEFQSAASSATRLASKLTAAVQKQELYETHQLLRTIYFRFINHKDKLKPLLDLLYYGAKFLLANREPLSGQDIAMLYLETSAKLLQSRSDDARINVTNSDQSFHRENNTIDLDICNMIDQLGNELPETETGRTKFYAEALKLLHPKILNRELMHTVLAKTCWNRLDYVEARYHFLYCANVGTANDIGELLAEYHNLFGNKSEVDLFLAQFLLQFLCMQNPSDSSPIVDLECGKSKFTIRKTAEMIIRRYHQLLKEPSTKARYPLFNFLDFITSILDASGPETQAFTMLCDIYKTQWDRDPNYQSYLNRIGVLYFGIIDQQQQQGGGNFFNNILTSLLDGAH